TWPVRPVRLGSSLLVAIAAASVVIGFGAGAGAAETTARIDVVQVEGLIDPPNAALIRSSLAEAAADDATLVVLQLDAAGAVDVDVPALVRAVRDSEVPVAAWVGPSGGRARGAAGVLALSADITAVAAGARIGPLVPVAYDHPDRVDPDPDLRPAPRPSRNTSTLQDFVASLDGREVRGVEITTLTGPEGDRRLSTDVHFHKLDLVQQGQHTLITPWVAYFLFVVGLLLIVFDFFTAGIGVAGTVGAASLLGGCYGFSHLPVAPWALALIVVGILGLAIDVQAGGLGVWTWIGTAALTVGSVWCYGGSSRLDPAWWVLVLVIGGAVVFMLSGMTAMIRSRFSTPTIGREDLVGEMGEAVEAVAPDGTVRVRDALWRARTNRATPIDAGEPVRVVAIEGVVLEVEPEAGGARDYRDRRPRATAPTVSGAPPPADPAPGSPPAAG
ncbi:MAG: NfeD family protein, partial [Actinomycetota bacterium]